MGDYIMKKKINRTFAFMFTLLLGLILAQSTIAQPPGNKPKPKAPMFPMRIEPDPRVEQRVKGVKSLFDSTLSLT
jgi:hypothetical protein